MQGDLDDCRSVGLLGAADGGGWDGGTGGGGGGAAGRCGGGGGGAVGGLRQIAVQKDAIEHVQDAHQIRGAQQGGESCWVLALVVKDAQGPAERKT